MNMQSHLVFHAACLLSVKYAHRDCNWKDWKFEELKGLRANETNVLVFAFLTPLSFSSLSTQSSSYSFSSALFLSLQPYSTPEPVLKWSVAANCNICVEEKVRIGILERKQQQIFSLPSIKRVVLLLSAPWELNKNAHQNLKASAGWEDGFHLWSSINGSVNRDGGCMWKIWQRNSQLHWILLWTINKTGKINNQTEYRYGSRHAHTAHKTRVHEEFSAYINTKTYTVQVIHIHANTHTSQEHRGGGGGLRDNRHTCISIAWTDTNCRCRPSLIHNVHINKHTHTNWHAPGSSK